MTDPQSATPQTAALNRAAKASLTDGEGDIFDDADFVRANQGLIAAHPTGVIEHEHGVAWDVHRHDFLRSNDPAPDSVHPSLWRQAKLNAPHGLFEVADGLWQVRGYDISNITFIKGRTGWIIIDPLTTAATSSAALELANRTLGQRQVVAVVYTHSHVDHFGGVLGVTSAEAVAAGDVRIIAPEGFLHEAVAENIIAGPVMARRAAFQFGSLLPAGPTGHVDSGLGKATPTGPVGLLAPTEDVTHTGEELDIDGVRFVFQSTPDAEAPAEMNFFFPDQGWLCMAENCSHNMHNLVPIRGAQVRDSLKWSKYIGEAIELFGSETDIMFASHHWPRWGQSDVSSFLVLQRDLYRWMHDQTMRQANHGLVPTEIAESLALPPEFEAQSHTRGYYGSLVHNVKAVYQRYLSWYDGNPAHLWNLPPVEVGRRYVDLAGGMTVLLDKAQVAFDAGDYRWVAELVNHAVFADPENDAARELQAAALEQLGYQSESATLRNSFLNGARELREGTPQPRQVRRRHLLGALTVEQIFDTVSLRLKAEDVGGQRVITNWYFTDEDERWVLGLENRALHQVRGRWADDAAVTVTLAKETMVLIMAGESTFIDAIGEGQIAVDGDPAALLSIFGNLDTFNSGFAIVEP